MPRPPPFITPPPIVALLSLGWLSRCPAPQPPSRCNATWLPWPPPLVVPSLITAFGVVCNSPLPRVAPLSIGWLLQIPAHQPLALRPSSPFGCCISQRLSLSLSLRITVSVVVAERVRRQRGASFAVAIFARLRCEQESKFWYYLGLPPKNSTIKLVPKNLVTEGALRSELTGPPFFFAFLFLSLIFVSFAKKVNPWCLQLYPFFLHSSLHLLMNPYSSPV